MAKVMENVTSRKSPMITRQATTFHRPRAGNMFGFVTRIASSRPNISWIKGVMNRAVVMLVDAVPVVYHS